MIAKNLMWRLSLLGSVLIGGTLIIVATINARSITEFMQARMFRGGMMVIGATFTIYFAYLAARKIILAQNDDGISDRWSMVDDASDMSELVGKRQFSNIKIVMAPISREGVPDLTDLLQETNDWIRQHPNHKILGVVPFNTTFQHLPTGRTVSIPTQMVIFFRYLS